MTTGKWSDKAREELGNLKQLIAARPDVPVYGALAGLPPHFGRLGAQGYTELDFVHRWQSGADPAAVSIS